MNETKISFLALGDRAFKVTEGLLAYLPDQQKRVLIVLPENKENNQKREIADQKIIYLSSLASSISKSEVSLSGPIHLLPDWEALEKDYDLEKNQRYFSRLCLLNENSFQRVEDELKDFFHPKPDFLIILADLSQGFVSGILWDLIAMVRRFTKGQCKTIALLGLPLQSSRGEAEDRSELYATLKEMNFLAYHNEFNLSDSAPLIDRTIFINNSFFDSPPNVLNDFLADLSSAEFLNMLLKDLEKADSLKKDQQGYAFSALLPISFDPGLLKEFYVLSLAKEIISNLIGIDQRALKPEDVLEDMGLSVKALSDWVKEQAEDLLATEFNETVPSIDTFIDTFENICLKAKSEIITQAFKRFGPLFAQGDLPGLIGGKINLLLDNHSLATIKALICRMEETLIELIQTFSLRLYTCMGGLKPLDVFIKEIANQQAEQEAVLKDQLSGKFLPAYSQGLSREEMRQAFIGQIKQQGHLFLYQWLEFTSVGQCLIYLQCASEELKNFVQDAMKIREQILSQSAAKIESDRTDIKAKLLEFSLDSEKIEKEYKLWLTNLPKTIASEAIVSSIRAEGITTEAAGTIFMKHLEKWYPSDFQNSLISYLKKKLDDEGSEAMSHLWEVWLKDVTLRTITSLQEELLSLPDGTSPLVTYNYMCTSSPKSINQIDSKKFLAYLDLRLIASARSDSINFYRLIHGFPLSFIREISSWFFDYEAAIGKERPVHVLKSTVYMEELYLEPESLTRPPILPLFWLSLATHILLEEGNMIAYPSKRACYWNIFWDREKDKPIWLSSDDFISKLEKDQTLQDELTGRLIDSLAGLTLGKDLTPKEVLGEILKSEKLGAAFRKNLSLESELVKYGKDLEAQLENLVNCLPR